MLKKYNIALLLGDGVGPELMEAASQVLAVVETVLGCFQLEIKRHPFGKAIYEKTGEAIPQQTLAGIKESSATLLGALDVEGIPTPSPMGFLRRHLELYADIRPIRSLRGAWSLKPNIDLVCIRENTEGFLADRNLYKGYGELMPNKDLVLSLRVITRGASERIARFAFEYARKNNRKKITVLHKAIVLKEGCGLFLQSVREVGRNYPDIEVTDEYVDLAANKLISNPCDYDILLTTNLFGDIISDEAAGLVSSLVPTANIGPRHALFLPIDHGPRSEQAKKGVVNPLSTFLCVCMLLEHLGETKAALLVRSALASGLAQGLFHEKPTLEITSLLCKMMEAG